MRKSKLMSAVKYVSMSVLGAALALGVVLIPNTTVNAETKSNSYCSFDTDTGILTLTGNVVNEVNTASGGIVLPVGVYKESVKVIVSQSSAVLPADSSFLFDGFTGVTAISLDGANTSGLEKMNYMFNDCSSMEDIVLGNITTSGVTEMRGLFSNCRSIKSLDLSVFDFSNVDSNNFSFMFQNCSSLKSIYVNGDPILKPGTSGEDMFSGASQLVGKNGTLYNPSNTGLDYFRVDTATNPGYLSTNTSVSTSVSARVKANGPYFIFEIIVEQKGTEDCNYNVTYGGENLGSFNIKYDGYSDSVELSVPAKELNTQKTLVVTRDGNTILSKDISVVDYLKYLNNSVSTSDPLYKITGEMLRYAAAAIKYFNPSTGYKDLPNYGVTYYDSFNFDPDFDNYNDGNTNISTISITNADGEWNYSGIGVSLDGELNFMMAFKIPSGVTITDWDSYTNKSGIESDIKAHITDGFKSKTTFRLDGTGKYVLAVTPVNILNVKDSIYTNNGFGNTISTGTYLYLSYNNSSSSADLKNVCKCLYAFHKEALAYKNSINN